MGSRCVLTRLGGWRVVCSIDDTPAGRLVDIERFCPKQRVMVYRRVWLAADGSDAVDAEINPLGYIVTSDHRGYL